MANKFKRIHLTKEVIYSLNICNFPLLGAPPTGKVRANIYTKVMPTRGTTPYKNTSGGSIRSIQISMDGFSTLSYLDFLSKGGIFIDTFKYVTLYQEEKVFSSHNIDLGFVGDAVDETIGDMEFDIFVFWDECDAE